MKSALDETHDSAIECWIESANLEGCDFPIQNLPFGIFRDSGEKGARVGVAIGDRIFDLARAAETGLLALPNLRAAAEACASDALNLLMALGTAPRRALRQRLHATLRAEAAESDRRAASRCLIQQDNVEMLLPASVGDYTDFYASIFHATNVGKLFRPDNPLLPNYKYIPIGYHGRASSLAPAGTLVRRPFGQAREGDGVPAFGPTKALDFEMELGFFVSAATALGETVPIMDAEEHLFGVCLLNDWSARDIQAWEYQPLGPFLAKSFCTSISPWVVTMEALAPFRVQAFTRAKSDPAPLPYLFCASDRDEGGLDLWLEVFLASARMRESGAPPMLLGRSNCRDLYWTLAQMLTHHASNGCNLRAGDLMASGTVSGAEKTAFGSLLELTSRGRIPLMLPTGELRSFLDDGDEVILRGYCEREGFRRIGLGSCRGVVSG